MALTFNIRSVVRFTPHSATRTFQITTYTILFASLALAFILPW